MRLQPWMAFASSRLALIVTGYLALTLFPAHPVESWQGLAFPGNNWIDGWVRWDSFWYESIVDPHPRFVPEYLSNANFFPFYSWVSWIVVAAVPRVPRSRARVLHRRADRVVGVVPARTEGGRSIDDEAGGRGRRGADGVADRGVSVLVLLHRRLCRRAVFLPVRVVADVCVRAALAAGVRAGGDGGDDAHSRPRAVSGARPRIPATERLRELRVAVIARGGSCSSRSWRSGRS